MRFFLGLVAGFILGCFYTLYQITENGMAAKVIKFVLGVF
jgi:hypothetical protein